MNNYLLVQNIKKKKIALKKLQKKKCSAFYLYTLHCRLEEAQNQLIPINKNCWIF